jgi:hypothetical protein
MDIETRLTNLENLVEGLINTLNLNKFYTDADINGVRQSVSEVTPYTETKTAYFNESEKTFYKVPTGNITVLFDNYNGEYTVSKVADRVTVKFDTLTDKTNITIEVK